MNNNLTELVFILDESGSMSGLEKDTIGGFNSFINKQKKLAGDCLVSTVTFSNNSKVIHDRASLKDIKAMQEDDYNPRGCTALLDALGDSVKHIKTVHKYIREEDRPFKTIFVIITDGQENASHKYSSDDIKKKIKTMQEDYNWEFIFLAANIDAIETAKIYGIDEEHSANYKSNSCGTYANFMAMDVMVGEVREHKARSKSWKDKIDNK